MDERVLTLSTATAMASIAVTRGETILGESSVIPAATQSHVLLPMIERLLTDLGMSIDDFDVFAAVHGPGAFTGLRVGISTIKGLALAAGKPVVGVSSLQSLALQVPESNDPVYAMIDARKGEIYAAAYSWEAGHPEPLMSELVTDPQNLIDGVPGRAVFVGDGCEVYRTLIVRQLGDRASFAPWPANMLRAGTAAMLALGRIRAGEAVSAAELNPVYIRASDAELNKRESGFFESIEG